jgi:hypothetical protein
MIYRFSVAQNKTENKRRRRERRRALPGKIVKDAIVSGM